MPELLEDYKASRGRLIAQTRELERLRQQVRASAEREAAAIVTNARRDVKQVLLDARRELLVLVAQLQAVGCDTPAADLEKSVVQGEATSTPVTSDTRTDALEALPANGIVDGAREVLLEAQTELIALAEEARELRARIARQQGTASESLAPDPTAVFLPEPIAAEEPEPPAPAPIESAPVHSRLPASGRQTWIAVAAAVLFAAVGIVLVFSSRRDVVSSESRAVEIPPLDAAQALRAPTPEPQSRTAASATAPAATDPSVLSVVIEVRRPAWIRTTIDGRADVGRLFDAGDSRTLRAREEIVMRAGDAGAVFVSVNGSEPKALGGDGRVVTRRFGNPAAPQRPAVATAAAVLESTPSPSPMAAQTSPADVGTTGTSDPATDGAARNGAATNDAATNNAAPNSALPNNAVPTNAAPESPAAVAEREILRATQQWFEAYFAGNTEAMKHVATTDFSLVDERQARQRLPATMSGVDRGLQQVRIEVAGDGAVMSARLTERANVDGQPREFVSLVSGVWIRTEGRWRLMGVRFMAPPAAVAY